MNEAESGNTTSHAATVKNKEHDTVLLATDRLVKNKKTKIIKCIAILIITVFFIIILIYGYSRLSSYKLAVERRDIVISRAQYKNFVEDIPFRGEIKPVLSVRLDIIYAGRVEEIFQKAGTYVTKNTPLFRISNDELELSVASREIAAIDQLNNQLTMQISVEQLVTSDAVAYEETQYKARHFEREYQDLENLVHRGVRNRNDLTRMAEDLDYWKKTRAIRQESFSRAQKLAHDIYQSTKSTALRLNTIIENTKRQINALTVRAPVSGLITGLDLNIGQQLVVGQTVGRIDQEAGFKVEALLDEFYLSKVAIGQIIRVMLASAPLSLRISNISPQIDNKQFKVEADFVAPPPEDIKPGQTLIGKLEISDKQEKVLTLPMGPFWETTGGRWVYVVANDGTARRKNISIGRRTTENIEVLSGLSPEEQVITSSYKNFADYTQLKLTGNETGN